MKVKYLVLVLAVLAVLYITKTSASPKPVEGYSSTPDPGPNAQGNTVVTPDIMEKLIQLTQPEVSKQLGKCTYCINTSNVELTGGVYKVRFLFLVLVGFAYGIGVDAVVKADENGKPVSLEGITFQSNRTVDDIDRFDEFQKAALFGEDKLPTLADLQSVYQNL